MSRQGLIHTPDDLVRFPGHLVLCDPKSDIITRRVYETSLPTCIRRFMLLVVALRGKYSSSFYLNLLLWLSILVLLGFAIRSFALPSPTGESQDRAIPATLPSSKSPPTTVRLYDVHDMINRWASSPYDHGIEPRRSASNNQAGNPQGGGITTSPVPPAVPDPLMDAMVSLISDTIHVDEWLAQGGSTATISYANRTLIIGGSPGIHHDVEILLRAMRQADANWPLEKTK